MKIDLYKNNTFVYNIRNSLSKSPTANSWSFNWVVPMSEFNAGESYKIKVSDLNSNTNPPTYMSRITKCITEPSFNLIKLPITTGTDLNNDGYNTFLIDSNDIDVCKSVSNTLGCNNPNFSNEDLCTMSSNVFKKYNMNFSLINSKNFNNKVKGTKINIYSLDNRQPNRRGRILNIIGTEL